MGNCMQLDFYTMCLKASMQERGTTCSAEQNKKAKEVRRKRDLFFNLNIVGKPASTNRPHDTQHLEIQLRKKSFTIEDGIVRPCRHRAAGNTESKATATADGPSHIYLKSWAVCN